MLNELGNKFIKELIEKEKNNKYFNFFQNLTSFGKKPTN